MPIFLFYYGTMSYLLAFLRSVNKGCHFDINYQLRG